MRGRPTNPKNLSLGYVGLVRVTAGVGLTTAANDLGVLKQDLASFITQFKRYAPARWDVLFPSAKGNGHRQKLVPLPDALGDVREDPRRRAIVARLHSFGGDASMIAALVGWPGTVTDSVAEKRARAMEAR